MQPQWLSDLYACTATPDFLNHHFIAHIRCTRPAGQNPDTVSYNTLIPVLQCHIGCTRPAGHSPDAVSYTTLITAQSRLGQSTEALQAFQELDTSPSAQPDLYAFNAIISALSVAGRMSQAESYLQRAAQMAEAQETAPPVEAFGAVIKVKHD